MNLDEVCICLTPSGVRAGEVVQTKNKRASRPCGAAEKRGWKYGVALHDAKYKQMLTVRYHGMVSARVWFVG